MNKTNFNVFTRGIKIVALALITVAILLVAIVGLLVVTRLAGYLAVLTFIASVFMLVVAVMLLFAQGVIGMPQTKGAGDEND